MYHLIIAGGRDFDDYALLERTVDQFLENIQDEITIFCGKARGADSLGEQYAKSRGYAVEYFPPDWQRYGRGAGVVRNRKMVEKADALAAVWDGGSRGTEHIIQLARDRGLRLRVTQYRGPGLSHPCGKREDKSRRGCYHQIRKHREENKMEWVDGLNETIRYIEDHLTEDIDYARLGQIACCSAYHYQRMFAYMAGVSLSEYIRRRRMSLAAVDLQSGERVLDVALKYGYQSPTAFNRAFQSVHGLAPSAVREEGAAVKSYPPLRFTIMIKGAEEMEYRIEQREAFRVVGVSAAIERDMESSFQTVPQFWGRVAADGTLEKLCGKMNSQPMGILGVCHCPNEGEWRYYVAAASTQEAEGFEEYTVPAATWAVFPGEGTNRSLQELERRILTEWLPSSGYEYGSAPDIEVYLNADPQNAKYEVWIPVVKKA